MNLWKRYDKTIKIWFIDYTLILFKLYSRRNVILNSYFHFPVWIHSLCSYLTYHVKNHFCKTRDRQNTRKKSKKILETGFKGVGQSWWMLLIQKFLAISKFTNITWKYLFEQSFHEFFLFKVHLIFFRAYFHYFNCNQYISNRSNYI